MKRFGITLALIIALSGTASAMDLYVATTGSDSNGGTLTSPFLTLQKGASVATPGTTIHVAPGTYNATTYCTIPDPYGANGTGMVCMKTSGTAGAPITFISDTKWGAKLECGTGAAGLFFLGASYIKVNGFDMTCPKGVFASSTYGHNGYNTFIKNYVHDISTGVCNSTGALSGADPTVGHMTFDSNILHRGGSVTSSSPTCNQFHGIYMGGINGVAVNNVVSGFVGIGIHAYGGGICNQIIANNVVFDNANGGIIAEDEITTHPDACANGGYTDYETITNNISFHNGFGVDFSGNDFNGQDGGIHLYGAHVGTHNLIFNNLVFGNNKWQTLATSPAVVTNDLSNSSFSIGK